MRMFGKMRSVLALGGVALCLLPSGASAQVATNLPGVITNAGGTLKRELQPGGASTNSGTAVTNSAPALRAGDGSRSGDTNRAAAVTNRLPAPVQTNGASGLAGTSGTPATLLAA